MKRNVLLVASLLMLFSLKISAQNERILLFECFTNTSCGPCAQQNPGLDALINNNADRVAAIKYHMNWPGANDPMYLHNTIDNGARRSVYNVNSVPHTVVDGTRYADMPMGLNQNTINQWLTVESPFEMRLSYEVDEAANTITVHVMGRASEAVAGTIKLYVGVIEREIHYSSAPGANGERDFYSVMKKLLPSSSGTIISPIQAGGYFAYNFTWELANVYNNDQLDAIAWIQNPDTKVVYQAVKSSQVIEPYFTNEAEISDITNVKSRNCSGVMEPRALLTNFGSNPLTTAEIEVLVNDESLKTINWTGNIATFDSETVEFGEIAFPVEMQNTLEIRINKVNGNEDDVPDNNLTTLDFKGSPDNSGKTLKLTILTDNTPEETTWKVTNLHSGEVVLEGGPYELPRHNYTETLVITGDGCYDFTIFDSGENGFDGGAYSLKAGGTTLFSGNTFGYSESNEFYYEVSVDVEENHEQATCLFPNPTSGLLYITSEGKQNVAIYNMVGQCVFESSCDNEMQIDMKAFGIGIYTIKVGNETQRVVVK